MRRILSLLLIIVLLGGFCFAATNEAEKRNFWTEFDVTFWQTVPFATFWGYVIAAQVTPGAINWNIILAGTTAVSAGNAYLYARKVSQ
ncbi:MAG: hypothetical protein ABIH50_00825 [bacterium]